MASKARIQKSPKSLVGHRQDGFTLVELMIVLLIASLVLGSALTVFSSQQKTYTNQQGVVDAQQNLRAGLYYIARESRLAGYCQDDTNPDAGIVQAGPGVFRFTMDIFDDDSNNWEEIGENDGLVTSVGEDIIYSLEDDSDGDGLPNTLTANGTPEPCALLRDDVNADPEKDVGDEGEAVLMNNVEAIAFAYAFDADSDGRPDQSANGNIIWAVDTNADGVLDKILDTNDDGEIDAIDDPAGVALTSTVNISDICMVRIWILARSFVQDGQFTNSDTYVVGLNHLTPGDHYRRRLLSTSILCRNM